jgi:hypothetical protein
MYEIYKQTFDSDAHPDLGEFKGYLNPKNFMWSDFPVIYYLDGVNEFDKFLEEKMYNLKCSSDVLFFKNGFCYRLLLDKEIIIMKIDYKNVVKIKYNSNQFYFRELNNTNAMLFAQGGIIGGLLALGKQKFEKSKSVKAEGCHYEITFINNAKINLYSGGLDYLGSIGFFDVGNFIYEMFPKEKVDLSKLKSSIQVGIHQDKL